MSKAMDGNSMPTIEFVFRFRDLVAPTIQKHREIIEGRHSCWWGWWKRPSEDNRLDVWSALKTQTAGGAEVPVGLFDSGSDQVYRAWISEIIMPNEAVHSAASTPLVPADQTDLVPDYYRTSPFSRAWMRMVRIEDPQPFFEQYSFAEAPNLPNYSRTTLARLKGKVILSADELRGMDTTIWRVRPKRDEDLQEEMLFSVPAVPSAVSSQVVESLSNTILHITDPHFAVGANRSEHIWRLESESADGRTTMAEAISQALKGKPIGMVLVTGDLTYRGDAEEFKEATTSLVRLLGIFDLSPDHLVVIPGNHDIRWTTGTTYEYGAKVNIAPAEARSNYENFYRGLFRHEPNVHLSMGRRYVLPNGISLEICALNSSSLETGKNFLAGMGRVQEASFSEIANKLGWHDKATLGVRLLALHHHLAVTDDIEPTDGYGHGYGLAIDAVRIQRMAAKFGVQIALHGHKHRAFIWRSSIFELPEHNRNEHQLGELSIVGGGSAGSTATESASNYFNLLTIATGDIRVEMYQSKHAGIFGHFQSWAGGFSLGKDPTRLLLANWATSK